MLWVLQEKWKNKMCGIAGFIDFKKTLSKSEININLDKMGNAITHRGPDSSGNFLDEESGLAFTHRRLAIIDLSLNGHQPMVSPASRYVITFNGEIYNHIELRKELEFEKNFINWKGSSDTETLLGAIDVWGIEKTLSKIKGMFAFILFDKKTKDIYLVRDRAGEKPLYYGLSNNLFLFASELKSIVANNHFEKKINRESITSLLKYNNILSPYSIYEGIYKLLPGSYIKFNSKKLNSSYLKELKIKQYWSVDEVLLRNSINTFSHSDTSVTNKLHSLLKNSVKNQMLSDVPLGAFLSGGIDSSTIVAIMQEISDTPIKTFTIGFKNDEFNEAIFAKKVANHLKTDHTELYLDSNDALDVIPRLPSIYDEPFADSSQIPTYLVSELTSSSVKVSLSGDGGDELFGGYNRYFWSSNIWNVIKYFPYPIRKQLSNLIKIFPPEYINKIVQVLMRLLPSNYQIKLAGDKIHKLANILKSRDQNDIYKNLVYLWSNSKDVVINSNSLEEFKISDNSLAYLNNFSNKMMYIDFHTYLPDDILTKVDRASMSVSLETRVPLLDKEIIEFAWQLPAKYKIRNGEGKWILRELLGRYLPRNLINRPKMGFGVPIGDWLRGPLKEWANDLLDESKIKSQGYLNYAEIQKKWNEHLNNKRNWQHQLWAILMFQAWYEANI